MSEAVGSPLPEPPEKMVPRGCLSPRAGPPAARERGGGGLEEEPVDGLAGSAAGPGAESRVFGLLAEPPSLDDAGKMLNETVVVNSPVQLECKHTWGGTP